MQIGNSEGTPTINLTPTLNSPAKLKKIQTMMFKSPRKHSSKKLSYTSSNSNSDIAVAMETEKNEEANLMEVKE